MKYIHIGFIANTHGLKGEVKVVASTDFKEERYDSKKSIYILFEEKYVPVKVKSYRIHKGYDLLTFFGYEDINLVEKYLKCDLFAEDTPVNSLSEDEYHINDLLNLNVIQNGIIKGTIKNILEYPQGDYLQVDMGEASTKLIPFRDEFVLSVDLENKCIHIADIEGLL